MYIPETENLPYLPYFEWSIHSNKITYKCVSRNRNLTLLFSTFSRSKTTLRVNVDPGNGKSTLLFILWMRLHQQNYTEASIQEKGKPVYFTFYAFSRSLQQQSYALMFVHAGNGKSTLLSMLSFVLNSNKFTRLCMCIQEMENLLYFLCFQ